MEISISKIVEALGGEGLIKHPVRHESDLMAVVEAGLPIESLAYLQSQFGFTNKTMSQILGISESTYQRRIRANGLLTALESEKAIELATVYGKGLEVFEDQEDFAEWLSLPIAALGMKKPVNFLNSMIGRRAILNVLNAIEHGVYL